MDFYYYEQPQITKIIPLSGPLEGGNEVALLGSGFEPLKGIISIDEYAWCDFQGVGITQAKVMNQFKAVCIAPSTQTSGKVKVWLSINNQEYTDDDVYYIYD